MNEKTKRQELSDHLLNEHGLICLESELDLIINIVESHTYTPTRQISDEEIEEEFLEPKKQFTIRNNGFMQGAKWMRDQPLPTKRESEGERTFTVTEILKELDECDHLDDARMIFQYVKPSTDNGNKN